MLEFGWLPLNFQVMVFTKISLLTLTAGLAKKAYSSGIRNIHVRENLLDSERLVMTAISHAGFGGRLNFDNTWVQFVHNTMPVVKVFSSEGCSYGNLAIHCGHSIFKSDK